MKQQAIILKSYGKRITLLEQSGQRFDAIIVLPNHYTSLSEGVIISYYQKIKRKNFFYIENVCIEYFPLNFARENIVLMHCLLEICFYFIPAGSCAFGVFDFFKTLYFLPHQFILKQPRIVIIKLLVMIGIYPLEKEFQEIVQVVLASPIDNMSQSIIELTQEDRVKRWMSWCIEEHPYSKFFKVIPLFLT